MADKRYGSLNFSGDKYMKLLFLIGNIAVGKMTVGQELMKITDLRLFHNHMTIEPVIEIFGKHDDRVITKLREVILEEFLKSDCYGLIFTMSWAFDQKVHWDFVRHISDIYMQKYADVYYVELISPQEIRLQRNVTENRLKNKASKRDIELSNKLLIDLDNKYRFVSNEDEITFENYIKIDNSHILPDVVARMIKEKFSL